MSSTLTARPLHLEAVLADLADAVNTTLDLDTLLARTAELIRRVIDYEVFAILLLNEKTQELRIRFQIGHAPEVAERLRIKVGDGVTGRAAQSREAVLVNDVAGERNYIQEMPDVRSELAVPLIVKNRVIGVIDIESRQAGYFTEDHKRLLALVASRIAAGIENARLYTRVARQAQTLSVLNEISRELTSILNLDELLQRIAELLTQLINYQMFSILLLDESGSKLEHRFSVRYNERIQLKHDIPMGAGLVGYAAESHAPVLVRDVRKEPRYIQVNQETRSELAVPLIYKGNVVGVLDLEHTRKGYFTEDHMRTLGTLAAQIAVAIENARLYERIAQEENRLERDLAMARELQFRLLPPVCPSPANADIAARYNPAHEIGGDMYDFVQYTGGRVALAIADVSGKGSPAALYAALVSGILRSSAAGEPSAAEMLSLVNTALIERPVEAQFVTMIYAVWDDSQRSIQVSNSGLPRPIICRGDKLEAMQVTGLPLGFFDHAEYDEFWHETEPGDVYIFLSDGIVDARNPAGDGFGRSGVEKIVATNCMSSARQIVDAIFAAVMEHAAGAPAFDDQTVVVLKVKDGAASPKPASRGVKPAAKRKHE